MKRVEWEDESVLNGKDRVNVVRHTATITRKGG